MASAAQPCRIIFHAGFHKTGTSHLQRALEAHADALAPAIRICTRAANPHFAAAAEAAREYSNAPKPKLMAALRQLLDNWLATADLAPGQILIASSEDFAGQMPGYRRTRSYGAAPAIARAVVAALTAKFGPDADIRLIYTTRAAEPWLRSLHWQLAKHPSFFMMRDEFIAEFGDCTNFAAMIDRVARAVPDVQVSSAALEQDGSRRLGMVEALYDLAGLPDARRGQLRSVPLDNRSPIYDLSEAYVALNQAGIPREALKRLKLALLASAELDRDLGE